MASTSNRITRGGGARLRHGPEADEPDRTNPVRPTSERGRAHLAPVSDPLPRRRVRRSSPALPGFVSSIRAQLTVWNVAVLLAVLIVLGATLRYVAQIAVLAAVDNELSDRAVHAIGEWPAITGEQITTLTRPAPPSRLNTSASSAAASVPARAIWNNDLTMPRLFDLEGRPAGPFSQARLLDRSAFRTASRGRAVYTTFRLNDDLFRVYTMPLVSKGAPVGVLQIAQPIDELVRVVDGIWRALLVVAPLAVFVVAIAGVFLTDRALRPVRRLSDAAEKIGAGNLEERLHAGGTDEFSRLGRAINAMLARLEEAFGRLGQALEQQRRFTADVSHELRTPLTVIKANTSLALSRSPSVEAYTKALRAADRSAGQMDKILQDLIMLARSDAGQLPVEHGPVPLGHVLESAAEPFISRRGPSISMDPAAATLHVAGDELQLIRLFTNLIDNAVRHTPPYGCITLDAATVGAVVVVTVADDGTGIPAEHLSHVCERFYRVDAARDRSEGGSGLGLSICRSIAEAHGGSLAIDSVEGRGTTVSVTLARAHA